MKKKRSIKKAILIPVLILAALIIICAVYLSDYYHAENFAVSIKSGRNRAITVSELSDRQIAFVPDEPSAGFIFYPGGKVQYEAYEPLMKWLAKKGILCVLVHMPGNLAVFDINAADGIRELYPKIDSWYIGGHSLGGSMAASYAAKHTADFKGLVLLASYSTEDLSASGLSVISLYGSQDGVLNRKSYQKYWTNLPENTVETVIEGGNHALFGSYGAQDGDGTPTISAEEQLKISAELIVKWMMGQ